MKKTIAIFFLLTYLFTSTEAGQLLKIPIVIAHYKEHQKEDRNISFAKFLSIHYLHGSPVDSDYSKDMQLPFKIPADCNSSTIPGVTPLMMEISIERPIMNPRKENICFRDKFFSSAYTSVIWQPPKIS